MELREGEVSNLKEDLPFCLVCLVPIICISSVFFKVGLDGIRMNSWFMTRKLHDFFLLAMFSKAHKGL